MLRYEESAEMYRHMTTIEQEKRGFQRLSELKKQMQDQEVTRVEKVEPPTPVSISKQVSDLVLEREKLDIIVVDTREFLSDTPMYLA